MHQLAEGDLRSDGTALDYAGKDPLDVVEQVCKPGMWGEGGDLLETFQAGCCGRWGKYADPERVCSTNYNQRNFS